MISELNIAERRIPQDGRIKLTIEGRPIDLRVSTLPTQFGESVVLRVLDKAAVNLDLDSLGLPENIKSGIRAAVRRPNGIFIVTGPTGSGKTTTLYSALREVNVLDTKILTAEDPVEYEIEGIMQVPVNHQVGLDFARALRAFLRQDPDKIMVGEIRDIETARIAVQASLTGHVVLSTLHTNDAPSSITRLQNMGTPNYLIASALTLIMAQRLSRKTCTECRVIDETVNTQLLNSIGFLPEQSSRAKIYKGSGCDHCNNTGYKGRMGIYEILEVDKSLKQAILSNLQQNELNALAKKNGFRTMQNMGHDLLLSGDLSFSEYSRVLQSN